MDFIRGAKITDRDAILKMGLSPLDVADTVLSLFGQMIFWDGFIHRLSFSMIVAHSQGSRTEHSDNASLVVILIQGT